MENCLFTLSHRTATLITHTLKTHRNQTQSQSILYRHQPVDTVPKQATLYSHQPPHKVTYQPPHPSSTPLPPHLKLSRLPNMFVLCQLTFSSVSPHRNRSTKNRYWGGGAVNIEFFVTSAVAEAMSRSRLINGGRHSAPCLIC